MYATSNSGIACSIFIGNKKIYVEHLRSVVLYGTYVREDTGLKRDEVGSEWRSWRVLLRSG